MHQENAQKVVNHGHVTVVGCGNIGSHLVPHLADDGGYRR